MKSSLISIVIFLLFLCGIAAGTEGVPADEPITITTDQAKELALANNLDIQTGLALLETARARVDGSDNRWQPIVNASLSYTRLAEESVIEIPTGILPVDEVPLGDLNTWSTGLSLVWPIYSGGELGATVRISELSVEGLEAQQDVLEDTIGVLAQNLCLSLRESRGFVVAQQKILQYVTGLLTTSEALFEQGMIPRNDLLRTQVEHTTRLQELENAKNAERLAQDRLNAFIGFDFGTQLKIEVIGYEPFFFETDIDPFYMLALTQRPEIRALDLQYELLEEERNAAQSGRLPDVDLIVSFDNTGDSFLAGDNQSTLRGIIEVSYDIYDGGEISDRLKELDRREKELNVAGKKLRQNIYLEIEEAYLALKQAFGEINSAVTSQTQAEENLRISRRRYEEGLIVVNDVIEAESLLLAAQLTYTRSTYNYYRAAALVGKAVGVADIDYYIELGKQYGEAFENDTDQN